MNCSDPKYQNVNLEKLKVPKGKMFNQNLHPNHCVDCGFLRIECICDKTVKHIKELEQEIENLKYKNNYLVECALEDQKRLQEKNEWLKIENELNDKIIKNLKNALSRMLELKVYPTVMIRSYDEWSQFENECKILVSD